MATRHVTRKLQEQVICPICMEFLQDPVTIDCGHNFCLQCISRVGNTSENVLLCPLCNCSMQRSTFRPNKLLANLVEGIACMESEEEGPEEEGWKCQQHKEKIYYFCEDDGEFLCVVCHHSKNHKLHCAILLEEAAQKYKAQILSQVQVLGQKEKKTVQEIPEGQQMIKVFMAQVQAEKEKITEEFKVLRQSLEEEEHFLLSRLLWLEQEGVKQMDDYTTITEEQLDALKEFKKSLVAKAHMPPRQLLEDIKETLSRGPPG